jgi:TonB-dependent receptor
VKKNQLDKSTMQRHSKVNPVAAACATLMALSAPFAFAQDSAKELESVVVTGIRKSLESSLDVKRSSQGVVDGIVAEDIGKFPDTNLAESMQRIAGVSIDRSASGEGNRVTVRGVSPDYIMVLLNGRQMPSAPIGQETAGVNSSRAFDFANLSSDSISALEVYKTTRASTPTGGIGATINIKTARPLDSKERIASFGIKANYDDSNNRLPETFKGTSFTPEVSGIYSNTFADGMIGLSISGSYSKRDSGSNKAYTQNGWHPFTAGETGWGNVALPGQAGSELITNRPTGNTLYATPVELRYSLTSLQRERVNGQLTLQFAPSKDVKLTIDHTVALNAANMKNIEISTWFNFAPGPSTWTNPQGGVAGPLVYGANFPANDHDLAHNGGIYGQKAENRSTGFTAEWKATNDLKFEFDAHRSTAATRPNSPMGTYATIDAAMFSQGNAVAYYDKAFPVLSLPTTKLDTTRMQVTGTQFRNNLTEQSVEQQQLGGTWKLSAESKMKFGLANTSVNNRSASVNHQNGDWGGVGNQGDYAANLFTLEKLPGYFSQIPGSDDPRLIQNFYNFDFNAVRERAIVIAMRSGVSSNNNTPMTRAQAEAYFAPYSDYTQGDDLRTAEKSTSAYAQYDMSFGTSVPMNLSFGLRHEKTVVDSASQVVARTGAQWVSLNEIEIVPGPASFGSSSGGYSYNLPSIDFDAELTPDIKLRASYGESIGRPGWSAIAGGASVNGTANFGGGSGTTGNPSLLPLLSKNIDFSAEYYYGKSSYVAGGLFTKDITNFIASSTVRRPVGAIRTPIGGKYYNAAIASGCATTDPVCQRKYIFANFNGQPGVTFTGFNATGEAQGTIVGQPDDPLLTANFTIPSNAEGDKLNGLELNVQHLFGGSGFGVSGNYTRVTSGLTYDNTNVASQSALVGVSNSYNLVGFYENDTMSARIAYNWRDKFLSSTTDGAGNNPVYTAPYGQLDMTLGYKLTKQLSLQADFINLNDGYIRQYGRTEEMLVAVTQTGRRYQVGARYRF